MLGANEWTDGLVTELRDRDWSCSQVGPYDKHVCDHLRRGEIVISPGEAALRFTGDDVEWELTPSFSEDDMRRNARNSHCEVQGEELVCDIDATENYDDPLIGEIRTEI